MSLVSELKRRNVIRTAGLYLVGAWLIVQVSSTVLPMFGAPDWLPRSVVILLALGFIPTLVFAWVFELTPQGIKRDAEVRPEESIAPQTARRMDRMIIVVLVIALVYFAFDKFAMHRDAVVTPGKSIAVLPFENLSRDPDNAYFAEGIQDEILTRLAKIADLKVISRTSTAKYKSAPDNLRDIAHQLGVANILEGSVQKSNDQVRVNVQLINATNDAHLWAEIYDRKLTDIFVVESDVAKSIADTLQARLSGSEQLALAARPTENQEAYRLYLKGRFFWNKRTADDLRKSIEYFNAAIGKDPKYALAYAGMAQAWLLLPGYGGCTPNDCFPQAEAAARKALLLDDTSSGAHAALGMVNMLYNFDVGASIAEFERAIRLDPNDATAHHWLANHPLAAAGQFEREIAEMKRALELDPLSLIINTNFGEAYVYAGRLDDAIAQLRKTVEMDRGFYFAHYLLGNALELDGQTSAAMTEYQESIALNDEPFPKALLAHLYATLGQQNEAKQILDQLLRKRKEGLYVQAYSIALVYLGLGDRDQALSWLEQAYGEHEGFNLGPIRVDPFMKSLHGDPRFDALAEKIVRAKDFTPVASLAK